MIVNNLPDVVSSVLGIGVQPTTDGSAFASVLEKEIALATPEIPALDPTALPLQTDTVASGLIVGSENGLKETADEKRDVLKASDITALIYPQLQPMMVQTPPLSAVEATPDLLAGKATAAPVSASGPLAQPLMLSNRKEIGVQGRGDGLPELNTQTDLNAGGKENVSAALSDKSSPDALKADVDASRPLTKVAEVPQFHSLMTQNKGIAEPATAASQTSSGVLNAPLGTSAWQQSLGQHVTMFTSNGIHNAELRLHPQELGAIQINLRLSNEHAQLHFVTENAHVRAAIEAAMPHLRSSLAESGIQLGQSSVGADASQSGNFFSRSGQDNPRQEADAIASSDDTPDVETRMIHHPSGINTFV